MAVEPYRVKRFLRLLCLAKQRKEGKPAVAVPKAVIQKPKAVPKPVKPKPSKEILELGKALKSLESFYNKLKKSGKHKKSDLNKVRKRIEALKKKLKEIKK